MPSDVLLTPAVINNVLNTATIAINTLDIQNPTATAFDLTAVGALTIPGAGIISADIQAIPLTIAYKGVCASELWMKIQYYSVSQAI